MPVDASPRQAILAVALKRFARDGFAATSTRDINADLGLTASAMYYHFSSKEEILYEILSSGMTALLAELAELLAELADQPASTRLAAVVRSTTRSNANRLDEWLLFRNEIRSLTPEHRSRFVEQRDSYEQRVREIVANGVEEGLWPALDIKLFVFNILALTNCGWFRQDGPNTLDEIAEFNAWSVMRVLMGDAVPWTPAERNASGSNQ